MDISFIIGFFIVLNLISIVFMWLNVKTELIKIEGKWIGLIFLVLSMLGGFIGVLVGNEMLNYKPDSKLFKRIIPAIVIIEVGIILYVYYLNMN